MAGSFDAAGSYLVLNDVRDYRGFAATLAAALRPGGRLVLAFGAGGLRLDKLADSPALAGSHRPDAYLPEGGRLPRFMLLAFRKG